MTDDPPGAELGPRLAGVSRERLGDRVWRLHYKDSAPVIAKKLEADAASTVELLARRWLPSAGLTHSGPALLRVAAGSNGSIWHLYEDLNGSPVDGDDDGLRALVEVVARLHTTLAGHPSLPEIRRRARDLGATVHASALYRVLRALDRARAVAPEHSALRERLYVRFTGFLDEAPNRVDALKELGGPETLLHGDLWPKNAVIVPSRGGRVARLIDWDRAGVGSGVYDLSTLLSRIPMETRAPALDLYRSWAGPLSRALRSLEDLNHLAESCERTRLAEWTRWRAAAIGTEHDAWAWSQLALVEPWLDIAPLMPAETELV